MKYLSILLMLFSCAILSADPLYYPTTPVVENFGSIWCGACELALQGLDVMEAELAEHEAIICRLLTESGEYSTPEILTRFNYYEVLGLPAVIFNGKVRVDGATDETVNGSEYLEAINQFRYLASPLKMSVNSFDSSTGDFAVMIQMVNDSYTLAGDLLFYLVEDDIDDELTHIVRSVESQAISLSGAGNILNADISFAIEPSWNADNLWAVAFIQIPGNAILQAASTLSQPEYYVRAAVPFDHDLHSDDPGIFASPQFWIYNLGAADEVNISIETISAPESWSLNYCDADGNCYPGAMPIPFSFASGEAKSFDLNLYAAGDGMAELNFVVESPNSGTYKIPFSYTVGPVGNDDLVSSTLGLSIGSGFPNPFKHSVSFEIQSNKADVNTALEIFNIRGQKVSAIPLLIHKEGISTINWDASGLPDGLYFYRLKGTRQSGKIIKIR